MTKVCAGCSETKSLDNFYRHKKSKDGRQGYCKPCANIKLQSYKKANPEKIKMITAKHMRKRRYGISEEEYQKLILDQNNLCAICNKSCTTGRNLAVDHNHYTGEVRGLLCSNCNTSLGGFQDNIELLRNAINYLEEKYVRD